MNELKKCVNLKKEINVCACGPLDCANFWFFPQWNSSTVGLIE